MIFFVISGKMVFLSSRKYFFSLGRKWKKMVFIKKRMGKWYFLGIWVDVTGVTLPFWQKSKDTLATENTPKGDIFGITKKDDIHPRKYGISAEIPHWLHLRKGSRSSHQGCSTRKGVLRNFEKLTEKDLCQGLFFYKVTGLGVQLY